MPERILVTAARWWDGTSDTTRPGARILVHGGRIETVGRAAAASRGVRVLDLGERTVLPGLIDCHVHLSEVADTDLTDALSLRTLAALAPLRDLLDAGFTTVRDLGGASREPLAIHLRDAIAAGTIPGPRLLVAPHLISARAGHGDRTSFAVGATELGAVADGADEVVRHVRNDARHRADWIKCAATGGLTSPTDAPDRPTYTQTELDALVGAATDLGLPCAVHAFSDEGIRRAVSAGVRSVEHACLATPDVLDLLASSGVYLVPTLHVVNIFLDHLDNDDFWHDKLPESREKLARHADTLRRHGRRVSACTTRVAFGTDAGMFPHADNWREFPAMTSAGFTAHRALTSATSIAADLLDRPDLGRITPGATADLIAVPCDPFHDIEALHHVDFVMRTGRIHREP
ncbi:metal-dependent hydrolase family protein [Streptomyces fulvorobeus]|uniref:Imidazolonepropionase-like amidohydrolase n=1 Tax=Streptomyces fulvorobeus TaxID=284028 RepID=A0A7J0CFA5_9ACTN|nr:amidohydrolase family protein [Streptomyces fulvorobeus]NYE44533.1 imidazolonepropionase-like amidohydrolase [Streptomyces fulvorobeus]GFN01069.1 Xaa-Pro dipeptidase [Streptomyces fulvorobeus]